MKHVWSVRRVSTDKYRSGGSCAFFYIVFVSYYFFFCSSFWSYTLLRFLLFACKWTNRVWPDCEQRVTRVFLNRRMIVDGETSKKTQDTQFPRTQNALVIHTKDRRFSRKLRVQRISSNVERQTEASFSLTSAIFVKTFRRSLACLKTSGRFKSCRLKLGRFSRTHLSFFSLRPLAPFLCLSPTYFSLAFFFFYFVYTWKV